MKTQKSLEEIIREFCDKIAEKCPAIKSEDLYEIFCEKLIEQISDRYAEILVKYSEIFKGNCTKITKKTPEKK